MPPATPMVTVVIEAVLTLIPVWEPQDWDAGLGNGASGWGSLSFYLPEGRRILSSRLFWAT